MIEQRQKKPFTSDLSQWIWSTEGSHQRPAEGSPSHYEVRRFRRVFRMEAGSSPELTVHVTADSRYVLYCNGSRVGRGPTKGDITHHFYETYDLSTLLRDGENVLAALVMDMSRVATRPDALGPPTSVMTYAGGFLLEGDDGYQVIILIRG